MQCQIHCDVLGLRTHNTQNYPVCAKNYSQVTTSAVVTNRHNYFRKREKKRKIIIQQSKKKKSLSVQTGTSGKTSLDKNQQLNLPPGCW